MHFRFRQDAGAIAEIKAATFGGITFIDRLIAALKNLRAQRGQQFKRAWRAACLAVDAPGGLGQGPLDPAGGHLTIGKGPDGQGVRGQRFGDGCRGLGGWRQIKRDRLRQTCIRKKQKRPCRAKPDMGSCHLLSRPLRPNRGLSLPIMIVSHNAHLQGSIEGARRTICHRDDQGQGFRPVFKGPSPCTPQDVVRGTLPTGICRHL